METGQKSESPAGKPAGLLGCCEKKGIGSVFLQRGVFLVQRFLALEVGLDASVACADIALVARRTDRLDENAREIEAEYGVKVYPHYMDLQDSKSITDCVSDVVAHFGKIDILVNAAGIPGGGDPATLTDEYWLNVINTDLNGQFFTCREVVRQSMKPNQYGRIIMVSSIHGVCGRKGVDTAPYAAAKGGIVNLTRSLGNSWARDGITVNCICPGYFPTEMTAAYIDAPFFHQAHLECCPMERHGKTGEMDGLCTYFASPACSYTTGQIVCVDGGWSAI